MIPFIRPFFDESDFQAIKQVLQSGWVAQGPMTEQMEYAYSCYLGCKHVISVTNCTTALTLALMALGIGPGDEVIVPDFTFPATALAVTNVGAKPVLVDVSMDTYNINVRSAENKITDKTKAIIPVHLFGLCCDIEGVMDLACTNGLFVVEDAACALGTENQYGDKVGTIGDIGCFSLHASKGITTGEGGLICTNDNTLADKMRRLACFGDERAFRRSKTQAPFYFHPQAGNYKMSDITAALALSQLGKVEKQIEWRVGIAHDWDDIISEDQFLRDHIESTPSLHLDHFHIYQSYVAVCTEGVRALVMEYMKSKGFQCGIGTHACHRYPNAFPGYEDCCETSNHLFENAISFPRYYGLNVKEEWDANAARTGNGLSEKAP